MVLLAGGRGSRLGGVWKALLRRDGASLLSAALAAVVESLPRARVVVVGPDALRPALAESPHGSTVTLVREEPAFAGPLAAVAAGLDAARDVAGHGSAGEPGPASGLTLLLAVDYVRPRGIVAALAARASELGTDGPRNAGAEKPATEEGVRAEGDPGEAEPGGPGPDALVPVDASGRQQPLAALWRSDSLRRALEAAARPAAGVAGAGPLSVRLADAPMRRITRAEGVVVREWRTVEPHLFDDVDTWEDAAAHGIQGDRA
ncbi:hypothetical protein GCM10022377_11060 [Zhihengliuella alba]|uniref:MobA-like NTP transferase domain-containing protein n=1 Tax=Zhihengliuella alba TaxID=547018 RepID=A0ABP7D675_9MICC